MKKILFPLFVSAFFFLRVNSAYAGVVTYPIETNILLTTPNITSVVQAGSSADSVTISDSTIVVTVSAPDSFSVRSDNKYNLSNNGGFGITCGSSTSTLTVQPNSGQQTVTITPTTTTCTASNSPVSAPSCGDAPPGAKAPWLYGAIPQDGNSILLYFTEADDPVDKYALAFGLRAGNYKYGQDNIGGRGLRTYLVQSLAPNTTYYFKVRGGNGCATGSWSNEISATTKNLIVINNLDIVSSELEPVTTPAPQAETDTANNCQTYTVKSGDTLSSVAANQLGNGTKFQEIIDQNKNAYPSIAANALEVGWKLSLNCSQANTQLPTPITSGYEVKVKVTDTQKKPVVGAQVTLHSTPQTTVTGKSGIAAFKNVEPGEHKVIIAYANYRGEQTVNLTGEVKEFDLNIVVNPSSVFVHPQVMVVIGILILALAVTLVLLVRARTRIA